MQKLNSRMEGLAKLSMLRQPLPQSETLCTLIHSLSEQPCQKTRSFSEKTTAQLRPDTAVEFESREDLMRCAPQTEDGFVIITSTPCESGEGDS